MAMLKQCSHRGCTKLVQPNIKYCTYHEAKYEANEKERYKEYQKRRLADKEEKQYQSFYNSDDWKRIREGVIAKLYGIDLFEYYKYGRIVQGETMHHIIELREDWNKRLDSTNLIYLTEKNHKRIHSVYDKGKRPKEELQKELFNYIRKFNQEFGF